MYVKHEFLFMWPDASIWDNSDPSVQNQSHVAENINWVFHMCRKRRIWAKNIYLWQLVKKLCSFEYTQYRKCKCQKFRFKVFIYYYWCDYLLLNTAFLVYLNSYFMCDTRPSQRKVLIICHYWLSWQKKESPICWPAGNYHHIKFVSI